MRREFLTDVPGVRWVPTRESGVGVLVLTGSSGRVDERRCQLLAEHGALAESVRWFGGPGQHDGPWEIPIETFLDRIAALAQNCDRILLLGTSFGAEAALLTGAVSRTVAAVIAFSPSDVVWAGVTSQGRVTSHWTLSGTTVSFVPFVTDWEPSTDPPAFVSFYRQCRTTFPEDCARAAIEVERIPELLLVAGGDDQVWDSVAHAQAIAARRERHGLTTTVVTEPGAGHRVQLPGESVVSGGMTMARGGTPEADERLGCAAWPHLQALLRPR